MTEIAEIPLAQIMPLGRGRVIHQHDAAVLVTAPGQWSFSAEAVFDISGLERTGRIIEISLQVKRGVIGVGWLNEGSTWVARSFIGASGVPAQVALALPRGASGGRLIVETATEGGSPAVVILEGICVRDAAAAPAASLDTGSKSIGSAEAGGGGRWLGEIKAAFQISRNRVPSA